MNETERVAYQPKKGEELLKFLVLFLDKHCLRQHISNACVASIISKIRDSGFISMRSVLEDTTQTAF